MMVQTILFWTLVGSLAFGFALGVQMRVMVALVLRKALEAANESLSEAEARQIVVRAANRLRPGEADPGPDVTYLRQTHPGAVGHLRLARKATRILPAFVFLLLVIGRKFMGVF